MRPGQNNNNNSNNNNNKRMCGRNNNRKGPNPLSRSYESNGPDVKVRGSAAHVAEKYVQLARDAHSAGDPVSAESYLQHAEHYYRLLMAAQQAQPQSYQQNGGYQQPRPNEAESDEGDEGDDEFDGGVMDRFTFRAPQQSQPQNNGNNGQPYYGADRAAGEGEGGEGYEQPRQENGRQDNPHQDGPRQDSPRQDNPRQDGPRQDYRNDGPRQDNRGDGRQDQRYDNRGPRQDRNERPNNDRYRQQRDRQPFNDQRPPRQPQPAAAAIEAPASALPAFITGGRGVGSGEGMIEAAMPHDQNPRMPDAMPEPEAGGVALRPRRRRRSRVDEADAPEINNDSDVTPTAE